ncbi:MAG TPA: nucleotidyltransferase family protein [Nocardioidaceae bacterium]|nr:nucleotidyltransferase family protein [Nocardioidaceae bacterium]
MPNVRGLLLAAGAGRRMGGPKALLRDDSGEAFVTRGVRVLRDGGCEGVTVVVGAAAEEVGGVLADADVAVTVAADWGSGMGASLRAGLADPSLDGAEAVVVSLVDLPDVGKEVVRRLLGSVRTGPAALARSTYDGVPGHPVLIGRDHWAGVAATAEGDRGAREYLRAHPHVLVECGDLATGRDTDTPESL